jgi:hypothetical protein
MSRILVRKPEKRIIEDLNLGGRGKKNGFSVQWK